MLHIAVETTNAVTNGQDQKGVRHAKKLTKIDRAEGQNVHF